MASKLPAPSLVQDWTTGTGRAGASDNWVGEAEQGKGSGMWQPYQEPSTNSLPFTGNPAMTPG